ncbi:MAG: hypothetical protein LBV54_04295 [Puniceicoccales bacterium]|nr:hypothetical protein [Puniceicoccales bacterium]
MAKGAVNAIAYDGAAQRFEDLEKWGDVLKSTANMVSAEVPQYAEIQLELAKGAFNAINDYGTAQRFEDLAKWGDVLKGAAKCIPLNLEFFRHLALCSLHPELDIRICTVLAHAVVGAWPGFSLQDKNQKLISFAVAVSASESFPDELREEAKNAMVLLKEAWQQFKQRNAAGDFPTDEALRLWWKENERNLPPFEFVFGK